MGLSRIIYNLKTIDLPDVEFIEVIPKVPRVIRVTRTGAVQTQLDPRMDISINARWATVDAVYWAAAATLKLQFQNLWQWAQHGNVFTFAVDSAKVVNTSLSAAASEGDTSFDVASATGILNSVYRLIDGPRYQMVTVTGVVGSTVTISETLNFDFSSGTLFRDRWYFVCVLHDENAPFPVKELIALNQARFEINLQCFESV